MALSMNDSITKLALCWVSHFIYCYDEWYYAEYRILFIVIMNVIMLSVTKLSGYAKSRWAVCKSNKAFFFVTDKESQ